MTSTNKSLKLPQLYYQSGLLTFMLFFIPVIPGFVEANVKAYLSTLSMTNKPIGSVEEVIRLLFGERGVKAYQEYLAHNPEMILPEKIFDLIYHQSDLKTGLKLMSRVFFDKRQWAFPNSDRIRASLYQEIPRMVEVFPDESHRYFRTQLVQKLASAAQMDQSILARLTAIDSAYNLLAAASLVEQQRKTLRANAELDMLAGRIKAELAGSASIYSAPVLSDIVLREMPSHLLTIEDIDSLTQTLHLLGKSTAPEIKEAAVRTIRKVNDMEIQYFLDVPKYYPVRKKWAASLSVESSETEAEMDGLAM